MIHDVLLDKLLQSQRAFALESLQMPGEKTEFEFGRRVGHVAGLQRAIDLLLETLKDEAENGKPL